MSERGKIFKEAPIIAPKRSWFDMSADHLLSMNMGDIVPVTCMECLPGDILKVKSGMMARFAPMLAPVYGKVNMFSYWFYVRSRDIWTDFDKFITNNDQRKTWQQQSSFVAPQMPRIKPLGILSDVAANGGSFKPIILVPGEGEDDDPDGPVYLKSNGLCPYYALVVSIPYTAEGTTIWHEPKIYSPDELFGNDEKPGIPFYSNSLVLFYRPNRADLKDDDSILNDISVNPFGRGQLFDHLGMSLGGVYKKQIDAYCTRVCVKQAVIDYEGASAPQLRAFFDEPVEEIGINLHEFVENHYIGAVAYLYGGYSNDPADNIPFVLTQDGYANTNGNGLVPGTTYYSGTSLFTDDQLDSSVSELPLRAYRFIYDEYFRDQNYIPVNPNTDFSANGLHTALSGAIEDRVSWSHYLNMEKKAWEHDPYTSALPGPQRGDAVRFLSDSILTWKDLGSAGSNQHYKQLQLSDTTSTGFITSDSYLNTSTGRTVQLGVDLSAATIENFRWANSMQKYLEKKARTGGRYFEYLKGIWNQEVADAKLNRPIYLEGSKVPVQISEILQTSASDVDSDQPLGQMAGRGMGAGDAGYIEYEAPDYGFLVQVVAVVPRVSYQSGLDPMFTRKNYLDYPLPDFAQLGEEYVRQSELWYQCEDAEDEKPFGYQSRYYQWKYRRDVVSGELADTLDFWTFARKFDDAPVMGKKFIECRPDYRQFAFTSQNVDHLYASFWNDIQVNRALPEFGVPTL